MYFLIFLFCVIDAKGLFAGNGITTSTYTDNGQVINFGCNTYDDCYQLFCTFLVDPTFMLTTIQPYPYQGNCNSLDATDGRSMNVEINNYIINNISQASILLCQLNKNKSVTEIDYYGFC